MCMLEWVRVFHKGVCVYHNRYASVTMEYCSLHRAHILASKMILVVLCAVHMSESGSVPVFVSFSILFYVLVLSVIMVRIHHNGNVSILMGMYWLWAPVNIYNYAEIECK